MYYVHRDRERETKNNYKDGQTRNWKLKNGEDDDKDEKEEDVGEEKGKGKNDRENGFRVSCRKYP